MTLTLEESVNWRREIAGWSKDILPFYDRMAEELPDGARCVEVGVYQGRSLCYLAERFHQLGKRNVVLIGVDSYRWHEGDLLEARNNLDSIPGCDRVVLVVAPSMLASPAVTGWPADLVFIDGFHTYEDVSADINAWHCAVKAGGMLAGHDYGEPAHPGVKKAVDEAFGDRVKVEETVWQVRM